MPNQLNADGLETKTFEELRTEYTNNYQTIYGSDINLDSDSPDGQTMFIQIQTVLDLLDLLTQIYNSFDTDLAIGNVLDQRVAQNGIQRSGGTFTVTPIDITVSTALSLIGFNTNEANAYTVEDNAGNEWVLLDDQSPSGAGTFTYDFKSKVPGAVLTTPNTITVPVTVVLGVTAINNPTTYSSLGTNEETDAELRIRRQKSVSLGSDFLSGLLAALQNLEGVTAAFVYENVTNVTDGDGIPAHAIWVIVGGTASDADIADIIYKKRNAGANMKGTQTYDVVRADGSLFTVKWDEVESEDLYIEFDASSLDGINPPNTAAILASLPLIFTPGVHEEVNINGLATLVQQIDPNTLVTNAGFSLSGGGPFTNTLTPSAKNKQFEVDSSRIDITVV